jgi:hypothetical protein
LRTLHSNDDDNDHSNPNGNSNNQNQNNYQGTPTAQQSGNPFDMAAKFLHIDHLSFTIPALPRIGLTSESKIQLIYVLFVGVLYLFFDYKAFIFAIVLFWMYKNSAATN